MTAAVVVVVSLALWCRAAGVRRMTLHSRSAVVLIVGSALLTLAATTAHACDAFSIARFDAYERAPDDSAPSQLTDVIERSVWGPDDTNEARGASTTPCATLNATNNVDPLVDFAEQNRATGFASEYTSGSGQKYYDITKNRGAIDADGPLGVAHHGGCSEVGCMLQAAEKGDAAGGSMRTIYNRPPNSPIPPGPPRGLGAPATPCGACQDVLRRNGVDW